MGLHSDISRRDMLALSAAAGGLALSGFDVASAQAAKKIEQIDPALDNIISISEPIKELASGFGGDLGPAEGPGMDQGRRLPAVQRHPQQPADEIHARPGRQRVPGADQPRQRAHPRPAGPAARLRARYADG